MSLEVGIWRADGDKLTRLAPSALALESHLENYIEADTTLMGDRLLVIGRQVPTIFGGFIDLLALDADGAVHVIELKRDKTPRDVVAQVLDYGSWAADLGHTEVLSIFEDYRSDVAFEEAFAKEFGQPPPEELNTAQVLTIVAASVDPATERIVRYLNEGFAVPVNVVFFRHFEDRGVSYLARTWLVTHEATTSGRQGPKAAKSKEPWNGHDWYVTFGEEPGGRAWEDGRRFGFISAGGALWYSRDLKGLPVGARVFAYIPQRGYVGVGTVVGEAVRFDEAEVELDHASVKLASLDLAGHYYHLAEGDDDDSAEYVVPVEWEITVSAEDAVRKEGMFANQHSACRLRSQFTIEQLEDAFNLNG